ncbi:MAG TPA: hypothetical protein VK308_07205 [Pyrinomonadaceae bacterium]|nr:hypothetical protein [Pyrinomonadaceae bacterium]
MNDKLRFQKQWEEYRRLRNAQYIALISGLIIPNLMFLALRRSGMEPNTATLLLVFWSVVAAMAILFVIFHFQRWVCPNCGKRFFVGSFWKRFPEQLSNCVNCNLPKYADSTFEKN